MATLETTLNKLKSDLSKIMSDIQNINFDENGNPVDRDYANSLFEQEEILNDAIKALQNPIIDKVTIANKTFNFPARFKMEGINPIACKCEVITDNGKVEFDNIAGAMPLLLNGGFVGPMANKVNGEWYVRFESSKVYSSMSN